MRKSIFIFFFTCLLTLNFFNSYSQCAMCRQTAESSQTDDNKTGRGLNKGILYLLAIPYIIGGIGVIAWYKNRKKD